MKQKMLTGFLFAMTLALIVAVVWYALRPDEARAPVGMTHYDVPATWPTYTSTKYDFSFRYPDTYVVDVDNTNAERVVIALGGEMRGRLVYEVTMRKYLGTDVDAAMNTEPEIAAFIAAHPTDVDATPIVVDGVYGKRYDLRNTGGHANTFAFFVTGSEVIRIAGNIMDEQSRREFDMVLSGFRFDQNVDVQF